MGWYEDLVVLMGIAVAILLLFAPPVHGFPTYMFYKNVSCNTTAAVASQPDMPCNFIFNHSAEVSAGRSLANGTDFYLANSTGGRVDFEIENNTINTQYTSIWFRNPYFNSSLNFSGMLYFGNTTAVADQQNKSGVWGTTYSDVWHFGETTGAAQYSSVAGGLTLTSFSGGSASQNATQGCLFGNCINGSTSGFSGTLPGAYTNPKNISTSCEVFADPGGAGATRTVMGVGSAADLQWGQLIFSDNNFVSYGTPLVEGTAFTNYKNWILFGMNRTGYISTNNVTIWTDGVANATGANAFSAPVSPTFDIGAMSASLNKFAGLIDECRVSTNYSVIQNWGLRQQIEKGEVSSAGTTQVPYGNLTIQAFDESTQLPVYFTATVYNSTTTLTIPYTNYYSTFSGLVPSGFVTVSVSNTTYKTRYYYYTNAPGTQNISAYLLNSSKPTGNSVNFIVQNQGAFPISNATINIYGSINGVWVLMGQQITDSSGIGNIWMDSSNQYQILVSAAGYQNFVTYVTPVSASYVITMAASGQGEMGFVSRNAGTDWMLTPNSPWDETATIPVTLTVLNQNCSLVWFAMIVYNGTNQLSLKNDTTDFCGNSLTYNFIPGPNATISVSVQFQNQNLSVFQQLLYEATYAPTAVTGAGPNEVKSDIANAFSPFAVSLIFLVISVMVGGWVGQFSPAFGILSFLIVVTMGFWLGYGLLGAGAILMMAILGAVAYQSIRGGFG